MRNGVLQALFAAQDGLEPDTILQHVLRKVSDQMNEELTWPFTVEEVRKAVFMMGPNKAPGPDGLTAGSTKSTGTFLALV